MKLTGAPTDMTHGKPLGLLLRFAIPLLIGNVFQQLYNVVDSLIVGNFVSTQALAAVSIGDYPVRVLLALFMGLGTGATIRISHHIGAGNQQGVKEVIQSANGLMLIAAVPLTALGLLIAGPVLRAMNTPADTLADAQTYLSVIFLGVISLMGYNLNAGILRGLGDSRSSLIFLIVATFVNIGLDLLTVVVFGWGILGAALATILAMTVAWLLSVRFLRKHYPQYASGLWPIRLHPEALRDMLRLGLPIALNDALFAFGHLMLSSLVNTHGTIFAAGYSVGGKVDGLSAMPMGSIAAAATSFVGQNAGARKKDRIIQGAKTAVAITLCWNIANAVLMLLFGRQLVGLFDKGTGVIEAGYGYILRLEPFYVIYGLMFSLNAVMNGVGEVRIPMLSNLVLFWVVRLPVAYWLSATQAPVNIFFCYPISWAAGLCVSGIYFLTGRWQRRIPKEDIP